MVCPLPFFPDLTREPFWLKWAQASAKPVIVALSSVSSTNEAALYMQFAHWTSRCWNSEANDTIGDTRTSPQGGAREGRNPGQYEQRRERQRPARIWL